jgi:hypothetical protein
MFRALSVSLLILLPDITLQLFGMLAVLVTQLLGTAYLKPWRVYASNYIEIAFSVAMQFVVATGAFYADVEADRHLSWACFVVVAVLFLSIPPLVFLCLFRYTANLRRKPYQYFLCHHKTGAGALARLMKITLQRKDVRVFLDSDNLTDLDYLFDQVRDLTITFVMICSQELFSRVWCVGEICMAKATGLDAVKIRLPCSSDPSDAFIGGLGENLDLHVLTSRGITLEAAQEALRWVYWQRTIEIPVILTSQGLQGFSMDVGFGDLDSPVRSMTRGIGNRASIVRDEKNVEASATALVLAHMLKRHFNDRPFDAPRVPDDQQELPDETQTVVLICTRGALEQESTLQALKGAMALDAQCLPVVAEEGFEFPASSFDDDHRSLADRVAGSDVAPEALLAHVRGIFKIIAPRFPASMASEGVLGTEAGEVARRLRVLQDDMARMNSVDSPSPKRAQSARRAASCLPKEGAPSDSSANSPSPSRDQQSAKKAPSRPQREGEPNENEVDSL